MHKRVVVLAASVAALSVAPAIAASAGAGWSRYTNERFGSSVEIPAKLLRAQPPPANGDGRSYTSNDGVEIRVYGSHAPLTLTDTFEEYKGWLLNNLQEQGVRITYQAAGKGWVAYSGLKGSTVVYHKAIEGCGAAHELRAEYPQALKGTYDPIVARVARSLRCSAP